MVEQPAMAAGYWQLPLAQLLSSLETSAVGLSAPEAAARLEQYGANRPLAQASATAMGLLLRQFRSPLVLILLFASTISLLVADWLDALIISSIVLLSALMGFFQERRASQALEALRQRIQVQVDVLRDGATAQIPVEQVVPGDVVLLSAGGLIPGDGVLLEAKDLFLSQAALTGETFPVEKEPGSTPAEASLSERKNCVFMGSHVRSGTGKAVIVHTGRATVYGGIAQRLNLRPPETNFERGIRHFGYLLTQVVLVLVLLVLTLNVFLEKPPVDSLLFALALAVGISPELLPAIVSITLSHGARSMAARGVIVRRLNAIENLGSMNILCTDKTGTLTVGVVQLDQVLDGEGQPADAVLQLALLNAAFETGLSSPMDAAILEAGKARGLQVDAVKLDEIPYDFLRKRVSVVVEQGEGARLISKGALEPLLVVCADLNPARRAEIRQHFEGWSSQGYRVLGVASRELPRQPAYHASDEKDLTFEGFLLFFDPPKPGIENTLADLGRLGVALKIITGDNRYVAACLAQRVGIAKPRGLNGAELQQMDDEALRYRVAETDLFTEVDPAQKERIIRALRATGYVVGYLGDGINDAPALQAADVGISVDQAVDVAKEAADLVLLERDLTVLHRGIVEGRETFANTMKYIYTTTSANFGNMISMALASAFLPFLPLLAKQILLNNLLSSIPAIGIAGDRVDPEWKCAPQRWDIRRIRNFMITFGLMSTAFDLLTFALLLLIAGASPVLFRTGWFVESLLTQLLIIFVIRTYKPFYRSRPRRFLLFGSLAVMAFTLALPFLPGAQLFDFVPLPLWLLAAILMISVLYIVVSEMTKRFFYRGLR